MEKPWLNHYEEGVPAEVEIPDHPVTQNLINAAEKYPYNPAIIFGNVVEPLGNMLMDAKMVYRQLLDLTYRFAAALQQLGVKKGDRVAIHMPNCPQFVIAYYATLMVGGIAVPCNPQYVAREMKHQLDDSGAETIITLSLMYPLIKQVRADTPLKHVIVTNIKEYFPPLLKFLFTVAKEKKEGHYQDLSGDANTYWFQDLIAGAPAKPTPVEVDMEDTAVLMYTGGTTGISKGAQLTHRNVQANAVQVRAWFPKLVEGQETILTSLPLYHSYAMTTCMNLGILAGETLLLIPDPRVLIHILKSINKHHPTLYPGVPALYVSLINHPDIGKYDVSSIKACISGAAPLPVEVQQKFQNITGGRLVEGYGLSEATPVTHANPIYGENRIGTIGLPFPSTLAKIVDTETGKRDLPPGEVGELAVRGPQVMKGYWQMPTETANVLRDGWLYTGDIARMDEDGYFQIVDRKKDMILGAGGYNIYPREIEEVLYQHPKVKEGAAVGIPIAGKGERVKVYIVLKEGQTATAEEIIEFCRENMAPYKVPKYVEFRDELPKTTVGKILRRVLLEEEKKKQAASES
ncbi:MAG: long-chain fatty acid--CoA ligase [Chloroflexi bacterium]|nr:MAG: long-chain fatty acid--CoA ligase [Chloroflexota bacterium]